MGAAAHSGNLDLVEFLIGKGADVNGPTCGKYDKVTVLMQATQSPNPEVLQTVMKLHPDLNATDIVGRTALNYLLQSARRNRPPEKMVGLLLAAGVDVNMGDAQGQTPLYFACENGHSGAVAQLVRAGANLNAKTQNGLTALMACYDIPSLRVIVQVGADLTLRDNFGQTAAEQAHKNNLFPEKAELLETAMKQQLAKH